MLIQRNLYAKKYSTRFKPMRNYDGHLLRNILRTEQLLCLRVWVSFLVSLLLANKTKYRQISPVVLLIQLYKIFAELLKNGRWRLPKHILFCMEFRYWFRSAELTTLLNRLRHCEAYSFSLELETAIAVAVESTSTILPPQIVRHPEVLFIFQSDFDNYDQLLNDICT